MFTMLSVEDEDEAVEQAPFKFKQQQQQKQVLLIFLSKYSLTFALVFWLLPTIVVGRWSRLDDNDKRELQR